MDLAGEYPEDDSEDLTSEEIAAAIPTSDPVGIVSVLRVMKCETCSEPFVGNTHELRRRKPNLFWRVRMRCPNDHEDARVFTADWLQAS